MRVGIDLVQVSRIAESIAHFGDRFLARVFTERERAYADSADDALKLQRLAARFAAKEATKNALRLEGLGWNEIEVVRNPDGACDIAVRGEPTTLALSMSHEGDHATAIVIAESQL